MKIGLILGGGGEVGIAWELGVLAALKTETGFTAADSAVVVGTSAGALVGALTSLGHDPTQLVQLAASDQALSPIPATAAPGAADGDSDRGTSVIPDEIMRWLTSREGTVEERGAAVGKLALQIPTFLDSGQLVAATKALLGTDTWPDVDFRPTSVDAETGVTILWRRDSGADLATAVASSAAVPGFFPPVEFGGRHYIDAPRAHFTVDLVQEKNLDALLYIGLLLPVLGNTDELAVLDSLAEHGMPIVKITGGPAVSEVSAELMDPTARKRAAEIGLDDGRAAAAAVTALLA